MAVALLVTAGFAVIDTLFVSRLGTEALSALGFALALVSVVIQLILGLSSGVTAAVAAAVGRNGMEAAVRLARHALVMALVLGLSLTALGVSTRGPMLRVMGVSGHHAQLAAGYLAIWFSGLVFVVMNTVVVAVLRGVGDTKTTAYASLVVAVLNAALDPLFIFGWGPLPALGVEGAALAAASGHCGATLFALARLRSSGLLRRAATSTMPAMSLWGSTVAVMRIALPSAMSRATMPIGFAFLTAIVSRFGENAAAAMAIYNRINLLVLMTPTALAATMVAFVGQNWAAGQSPRARMGLEVACRFAALWGLGAWAVLALVSNDLAAAFSKAPAVVATTSTFFRLAPSSFAAAGIIAIAASSLVGAGNAGRALGLIVVNQLVFAVLFAFAGRSLGVQGVLIGHGLGHFASLFVCRRWLQAAGLAAGRPAARALGTTGTVP